MLITTVKNRILRHIVVVAVFVAALLLFTRVFNHHTKTESASDLSDPTLPVMCMDIEDNKVNRMEGYLEKMDTTRMRDSLVPINTKRSITVSYRANRNNIKSVSYEVTAPDTGEVIENAKIGGFSTDGDYKTATFALTEPILMNREYPIRFTITTDSREIYYYSRVIQRPDIDTDLYVQFVYDFYEGCTSRSGSSDINTYLETDNTIVNNSFTNVNIKSSLSQVTWGSLDPQIYRKAVPTICEINTNTASLTADYIISAENSKAETEYYHVREFYRLRYYNGAMHMLNFERNAQQIFNPTSKTSFTSTGVNLGVASRTVPFYTNSLNDIVVFIQDNELYEYSRKADRIDCVFSMHGVGDNTDERYDNEKYSMKILRVSEDGDIDFTVEGYFSRGEHEGHMGIALCHYNSENAAVTERAFLDDPRSWELVQNDLHRLTYYSSAANAFYFYLDGVVWEMNLETGRMSEILKDINPDCFVASDEGGMIAWMPDMKEYSSASVRIMDLDTQTTRDIEAGNGQYLRALGFLNEDLLYGIADQDDIARGVSGTVTFAMKELRIESFEGKVIKDYVPDGCFVSDVTMKEGLAELTRVKKAESGYEETTTDNIMNNRQKDGSEIVARVKSNSRQENTILLQFAQAITNLSPTSNTFRIRYASGKTTADVTLQKTPAQTFYYVYASGKLQEIITDPAKAVRDADAMVGVVLNSESQYVYERGNVLAKTELANDDIPSAMLSGEIDADRLQKNLGDDATVMNLTGCSLETVLYQVSQGRAVVTRLADGSVTVIVGYDRYNTLLYNFSTGEHYYMGMNDSTNSFLTGGNVFVTYIEPQATVKKDS